MIVRMVRAIARAFVRAKGKVRMKQQETTVNPVLASSIAPSMQIRRTHVPVGEAVTDDDFVESLLADAGAPAGQNLEQSIDPGATGGQAGSKPGPSPVQRESTQMPVMHDPSVTLAPVSDTEPPPQLELPGVPESGALAFAGALGGQFEGLERIGVSARVEAEERRLTDLKADRIDLQDAGVRFANLCSELASASGLTVIDVFEMWDELAVALHANRLGADLPGCFLTLRSIVALLGAARTLRETLPDLAGVDVERLARAYWFGTAKGADLEARGVRTDDTRAAPKSPKVSAPPKEPVPAKSPAAPKPTPLEKRSHHAPADAESKAAKEAERLKKLAEREAQKREAEEERERQKQLKELERQMAALQKPKKKP